MPPYRAQLGGIAGSGVYMHPSAAPDWGAIIGSIGQGASSLIHNAYLRKIADRNYALNVQRLNNEMELHKATLAATQAYHQAMLGMGAQRLAAPDARKTKANQQAFTDLQHEFPEHHLVAPDPDSGETKSFDPENQDDYVGALKTARTAKATADKALAAEHYKTDNMEKAAKLRAWVQSQGITQRAGVAANKAPTAAQTEKAKQDFLKQLGTLSGGDPQKARDILGSDKDAAAAANKFGVKDYEVAAAAGAVGSKAAAADTKTAASIFSGGMAKTPEEAAAAVPRLKVPATAAPPAGGPPASNAAAPGGAGPAATAPAAPASPPMLKLPVGPGANPGGTGLPANPVAPTAAAPAPLNPAARAPLLRLPPPAPGPVPQVPVAPAAAAPVVPVVKPAASPYPSQAAHWDAAAAALRGQKKTEDEITKMLGARPVAAPVAPAKPVKPEEEDEEPPVSSGII